MTHTFRRASAGRQNLKSCSQKSHCKAPSIDAVVLLEVDAGRDVRRFEEPPAVSVVGLRPQASPAQGCWGLGGHELRAPSVPSLGFCFQCWGEAWSPEL